MTESENFLERWSRLKREAASAATASGEGAPAEAPSATSELPAVAFDPTSLPPIELIDAATDIRPFLEACVPEELTRAALRSAWSADPAIRGFIGIAENQWDFNDPATIPGFSGHATADYLCSLVAPAGGSVNTAFETQAGGSELPQGPVAQSSRTADSDPAATVGQVTEPVTERPHDADVGAPVADACALPRTHGSALPR
jgi:Protein of unknown function (DUF3306)